MSQIPVKWLADQLAEWAVTFRVTHTSLSALLSILRVFHTDLPKDPRTLLRTGKNYTVQTVAGGSYYHFGIASGILQKLGASPNCTLEEKITFQMADEGHHRGPSPFRELNIGMVSQFPLDYMHLVCLGVMRRLLWLWRKGPLQGRISSRNLGSISNLLVGLVGFIPGEFSRKPRPLMEVDRWKATEFRQLLLYTGPVVLLGNLRDALYKNFLLLHVALYILVSPSLCQQYCDYAEQLLVLFVTHYSDL